jgi:FkbM family methyltransferase
VKDLIMRRLIRGLGQSSRFPEVLHTRSVTPDWLALTMAYLGLRRPFPFSIRLATGPFEFREWGDVPTFWRIFFAELYPVELSCRLVIDAGANIGAFTLFTLINAPHAHVIAVEPAPDTCERMRRTLDAHGFTNRCTIMQAALAAESGTTTISLGGPSQTRRTGQGGVEVPTVTLDSLLAGKTADLLKLDVQGAEYAALPAASPDTLSRIRRIEMEYHPWGNPEHLFTQMTAHGFILQPAHGNRAEPGYGMATLLRA